MITWISVAYHILCDKCYQNLNNGGKNFILSFFSSEETKFKAQITRSYLDQFFSHVKSKGLCPDWAFVPIIKNFE